MYEFCSSCPCNKQLAQEVAGDGVDQATYMFIGDYPAKEDIKKGKPFQNIAGQLLKAVLGKLDITSAWYTYMCQCRPEALEANNYKIEEVAITACIPNLMEEINKVKPKAIILLGEEACKFLFPLLGGPSGGLVRNSGLGVWSHEYECNIIALEHPYKCFKDPDKFTALCDGLRKIQTITDAATRFIDLTEVIRHRVAKNEIDVQFVTTKQQALKRLARIPTTYPENTFLSLDIETTGLNPLVDRPILIGINVDNWVTIIPHEVMLNAEVYMKVQEILDHWNDYSTGHNARFDAKFLKHHYGINWNIGFDTMLAHYILCEVPGTHSLKTLARNELNASDYAFNITEDFKAGNALQIDLTDLATYLTYDVLYTSMLAKLFLQRLEDSKMLKIWDEILRPANDMFRDTELVGVPINRAYLEDLGQEYTEILNQLREQAVQIASTYGMPDINIQSPQQVGKLLYDVMKNPLPKAANAFVEPTKSTDKDALEGIVIGRDFVNILLEYRQYAKLQSTYIRGMLTKEIRGKVYPEFLLHGTVTGRLACRHPNLQNIPQVVGPVIRDAFQSPQGFVFLNADYSQLELRIAALLANDMDLVNAFLSGDDFHLRVASEAIFHKPPEEITKQERHKAKFVNFGIVYGRGAKSLAEGELQCTIKEAQTYIDNWYAKYSKLRDWRIHQLHLAKTQGYVTSIFGRKRRFPLVTKGNLHEIEKQCVNAPIQSSASDLCLLSMAEIHAIFPHDFIQPLFPVHDSILFLVPEARAEEAAGKIKEIMEQLPFKSPLPFPVDIKIGTQWGKL